MPVRPKHEHFILDFPEAILPRGAGLEARIAYSPTRARRWSAGRMLGIWLACVGTHSCTSADGGPVIVQTDSAGVSLVTISSVPRVDDPDYAWRLTPGRALRSAPPDPGLGPLLYNPQAALRMADGTLVVLDGNRERLVVVSATVDSVLIRFAPIGQGPGEMSAISIAPIRQADAHAFWIYDGTRRRLSRFTTRGRLVDEVHLGPAGGPLVVSGHFAATTGEFWVAQFFPAPDFGVTRFAVDSLGWVDFTTGRIDYRIQRPERVRTPPGPAPFWHPRSTWTVLGNGSIVTGRNDLGVFDVYDSDGRHVRRIRTDLLPTPVSPAARQEADAWSALNEGTPAELRRYNPTVPLYRDLLSIGDTIFAIEHRFYEVPTVDSALGNHVYAWRLISVNGVLLGAVVFREGFTPWGFTGGRVLGVVRDSFGIATLHDFQLQPPS